MFGRGKTQQPAVTTVEEPVPVKAGGKGRPTPKRREAELRNHKPVIAGPKAPGTPVTKEEKRAAKAERREARAAERARTNAAVMAGDERYLPARDKGPARRFVRDYVDARRNPGEYFLWLVLVSFIVVIIGTNLRTLVIAATAVLYAALAVVALDSFLLARRVRGHVRRRFGDADVPGVSMYAVMRAMQLRRSRAPRPRLKPGDPIPDTYR